MNAIELERLEEEVWVKLVEAEGVSKADCLTGNRLGKIKVSGYLDKLSFKFI